MVVYHHVIGATATTVAFLLNSFLLFIIVKYSSDKLGIYKHFLFVYTLNAVYYCVIQFLLLEVNSKYPYFDNTRPDKGKKHNTIIALK